MLQPDELGQILPGFLADVVLLDENPLLNLASLTDPKNIVLVMKDGVMHKDFDASSPRTAGMQLADGDNPFFDYGVTQAIQSMAH